MYIYILSVYIDCCFALLLANIGTPWKSCILWILAWFIKPCCFRGAGCGVKEYTCSVWCTGPTAASLPAVITAAIVTHYRENGVFSSHCPWVVWLPITKFCFRGTCERCPRVISTKAHFSSALEREWQRGKEPRRGGMCEGEGGVNQGSGTHDGLPLHGQKAKRFKWIW